MSEIDDGGPADTRPTKCSLSNEDRVRPCWALSDVLDDPHGRGTRAQGVSLHFMVDMETCKSSGSLAVLKSGKHNKKGVILNYCPFCGEWINKYVDPADRPAARKHPAS